MIRSNKSLAILLVAVLGLWGCSRSASSNLGGSTADRLRVLEQKCVKLEDDCRNLLSLRDQMRKHVSNLEAENVQLVKEKKVIEKERDNLRQMVEARSQERDQLQARNEKLKKGIQSLLGQDEAAAANSNPSQPVTSTPLVNDSNKS